MADYVTLFSAFINSSQMIRRYSIIDRQIKSKQKKFICLS